MKENPLQHSLSQEKVLHVFFNNEAGHRQSIIILDGYGQEWKPLLDNEVESFTYLERPICNSRRGKATTSQSQTPVPRQKNQIVPPSIQAQLVSKESPKQTKESQRDDINIQEQQQESGAQTRQSARAQRNRRYRQNQRRRRQEALIISKENQPEVELPRDKSIALLQHPLAKQDDATKGVVDPKIIEPRPFSKTGECYGNTTIPVEYAGHNHLAILDCGAGIAIAT